MKILCHVRQCKWVHVTDIICGKNRFNVDITRGLYQCSRCGEISQGGCSKKPRPAISLKKLRQRIRKEMGSEVKGMTKTTVNKLINTTMAEIGKCEDL